MGLKTLLFVGENRSNRAREMNVTWEDGHLSAKTLFDALKCCDINPKNCIFTNLWKGGKLIPLPEGDFIIIGMGRKVQKELKRQGIDHIRMIHPAARGKIRKKENYMKHVKSVMESISWD